MKRFLMGCIRFYRKRISPLFPPMCRYHPTCSQYALEAIETHGAFKGFFLSVGRLLRCNVLFPGGYDPVPPKREKKTKVTDSKHKRQSKTLHSSEEIK